jgi:ATP-dependent protease ClpP protease subunit
MSDKHSNSNDDIVNDYFTIKTKAKVVKTHRYDIYICNHIHSPNEYVDIIDVLLTAKATDEVHIYLNSGGGWCRTTTQIVNAMKYCKAPITCHASGLVASCATWIFLAGNNFVIDDDIEFMCHFYSGGMYGKGNEIKADADFSIKYYEKLFKKIYKDFLTKDEIKKLIEGKDYYFTQKQVAKRLKKKYESNNVDIVLVDANNPEDKEGEEIEKVD